MASKEDIEWILHGASIQLQQRKALWLHTLSTILILLPTLAATFLSSHLLKATLDTFELPIEPVLHAEHSINGVR